MLVQTQVRGCSGICGHGLHHRPLGIVSGRNGEVAALADGPTQHIGSGLLRPQLHRQLRQGDLVGEHHAVDFAKGIHNRIQLQTLLCAFPGVEQLAGQFRADTHFRIKAGGTDTGTDGRLHPALEGQFCHGLVFHTVEDTIHQRHIVSLGINTGADGGGQIYSGDGADGGDTPQFTGSAYTESGVCKFPGVVFGILHFREAHGLAFPGAEAHGSTDGFCPLQFLVGIVPGIVIITFQIIYQLFEGILVKFAVFCAALGAGADKHIHFLRGWIPFEGEIDLLAQRAVHIHAERELKARHLVSGDIYVTAAGGTAVLGGILRCQESQIQIHHRLQADHIGPVGDGVAAFPGQYGFVFIVGILHLYLQGGDDTGTVFQVDAAAFIGDVGCAAQDQLCVRDGLVQHIGELDAVAGRLPLRFIAAFDIDGAVPAGRSIPGGDIGAGGTDADQLDVSAV